MHRIYSYFQQKIHLLRSKSALFYADFGMQNGAFCVLKRCVLHPKSASFAVQKWQFCNAKVAVLENGLMGVETKKSPKRQCISRGYTLPLRAKCDKYWGILCQESGQRNIVFASLFTKISGKEWKCVEGYIWNAVPEQRMENGVEGGTKACLQVQR